MRKALLAVGLLALLSGTGFANLIVNGDFEEPFETGWKDTVFSMAGDFRFERSDTFGLGTGYAAKAYKYLASFASLRQAVPVTGVDLTLSFDAKLVQYGGSSTCWPVAAFFARYLNAEGFEIGATCWYNHSIYADWRDNDTMNLIEITSDAWNHYEISVANEIATNLPGVNAADVAMVCVDLFAYDNGT